LFLFVNGCAYIQSNHYPYPQAKIKETFYRSLASSSHPYSKLSLSDQIKSVLNAVIPIIKKDKEYLPLTKIEKKLPELKSVLNEQMHQLFISKVGFLKEVKENILYLNSIETLNSSQEAQKRIEEIQDSDLLKNQGLYLDALGAVSYLYILVAHMEEEATKGSIYSKDWSVLDGLALVTHSSLTDIAVNLSLTGENSKTLTPAQHVTPSVLHQFSESGANGLLRLFGSNGDKELKKHLSGALSYYKEIDSSLSEVVSKINYEQSFFIPNLKAIHVGQEEKFILEYKVLDAPKTKIQLAKLNQFLGVRELMVNSWGIERLTQKYNVSLKDCAKGALNFKFSNKNKSSSNSQYMQDLWRADFYFNNLRDIYEKGIAVASKKTLGSLLEIDESLSPNENTDGNYTHILASTILDIENVPEKLKEFLSMGYGYVYDEKMSYGDIVDELAYDEYHITAKRGESRYLAFFLTKKYFQTFNYYDEISPESIASFIVLNTYSARKQGLIDFYIKHFSMGLPIPDKDLEEIERYFSAKLDFFAMHWTKVMYKEVLKEITPSFKSLAKKTKSSKLNNIHEFVNYHYVIDSLKVINASDNKEKIESENVPMSSVSLLDTVIKKTLLSNFSNKGDYDFYSSITEDDRISKKYSDLIKAVSDDYKKFFDYLKTDPKKQESLTEEDKEAEVWKSFIRVFAKEFEQNPTEDTDYYRYMSLIGNQVEKIDNTYVDLPTNHFDFELVQEPAVQAECSQDILGMDDECKEEPVQPKFKVNILPKKYKSPYDYKFVLYRILKVFDLDSTVMKQGKSALFNMERSTLRKWDTQLILAKDWIEQLENLEPFLKTRFEEKYTVTVRKNISGDPKRPDYMNVKEVKTKELKFSDLLVEDVHGKEGFSKNHVKELLNKTINLASVPLNKGELLKNFCEADYRDYKDHDGGNKDFKVLYNATKHIRKKLVAKYPELTDKEDDLEYGVNTWRYVYREAQMWIGFGFLFAIIVGSIFFPGTLALLQVFSFALSLELFFLGMDLYDINYALNTVPQKMNFQKRLLDGHFLRKSKFRHPREVYSLESYENLDAVQQEYNTEVKFIAAFSPLTIGGFKYVGRAAKIKLARGHIEFLAKTLDIGEVAELQKRLLKERAKNTRIQNLKDDLKILFTATSNKTVLPVGEEVIENAVYLAVKKGLNKVDVKLIAKEFDVSKIEKEHQSFYLLLHEVNRRLDVNIAKASKRRNLKLGLNLRQTQNIDPQKLVKLGKKISKELRRSDLDQADLKILDELAETLDSLSQLTKSKRKELGKANPYKIGANYSEDYMKDFKKYVEYLDKLEAKYYASAPSKKLAKSFKKYEHIFSGNLFEKVTALAEAKKVSFNFIDRISKGSFQGKSLDEVYSLWMKELDNLEGTSKAAVEEIFTKRSLKENALDMLLTIKIKRPMTSIINQLFSDIDKAMMIKEDIVSAAVQGQARSNKGKGKRKISKNVINFLKRKLGFLQTTR